jgi:uncharacterized protein YjbI with pentapeptide repeats
MAKFMDYVNNGERLSTQKFQDEYARGRRDFSYTNLTEIKLPGMNLCEIDLRGANLSYANLSDANLSWANLSGTNLAHTKLHHTNLSWADLDAANPEHAQLKLTTITAVRLPWGVYIISHKKARKEFNEN